MFRIPLDTCWNVMAWRQCPGVTFDRKLTFAAYINRATQKAKSLALRIRETPNSETRRSLKVFRRSTEGRHALGPPSVRTETSLQRNGGAWYATSAVSPLFETIGHVCATADLDLNNRRVQAGAHSRITDLGEVTLPLDLEVRERPAIFTIAAGRLLSACYYLMSLIHPERSSTDVDTYPISSASGKSSGTRPTPVVFRSPFYTMPGGHLRVIMVLPTQFSAQFLTGHGVYVATSIRIKSRYVYATILLRKTRGMLFYIARRTLSNDCNWLRPRGFTCPGPLPI